MHAAALLVEYAGCQHTPPFASYLPGPDTNELEQWARGRRLTFFFFCDSVSMYVAWMRGTVLG